MHCLEMINTFAREVENRDPQFPFEAIGRGRTSTPADWKTTCKRTDNKDDNQHPVSKEIDAVPTLQGLNPDKPGLLQHHQQNHISVEYITRTILIKQRGGG